MACLEGVFIVWFSGLFSEVGFFFFWFNILKGSCYYCLEVSVNLHLKRGKPINFGNSVQQSQHISISHLKNNNREAV